ncbi:MAG: AAA family ATPase [Planctomycetota bacterium]
MNWKQLASESLDGILAWAENQPWCRSMAECAQDVEWHSEGDVWTHTKMVCHQLTRLDEWDGLSDHDKTVLIFTALFHDAAKPLTSRVDSKTGRITSPNHAVKGEHLVRGVLRELDCDLDTREQIARLVRYHGRPAFLMERSEPVHEVVRLSWLVENCLLYLFAVADTRGRNTDSITRPEENLNYWKLQADELDCYCNPYDFASEHARFTFFRQREPNLHYVPHEDYSCRVTVMSGLPGSGKNTWLSQNRGDLPVIELDDIRDEFDVDATENQGMVVQTAKERCREYLRAGTSFAFNATNTMKQTRGRWIDLFADYKARIEVVYVEPPFKLLLKQNRNRQNAVPERVITKLAAKCEPPTWLEAHKVIFSTGDS